MNPRALLPLCVLALAGSAVWMLQSDHEPSLPGRAGTEAAAPDTSAPTASDAAAVEATGGGVGNAEARAAVATGAEPALPFPEDAVFVEVRIVDKTSGEPVAEAAVAWGDQSTVDLLGKREDLGPEERQFLRRDTEALYTRFGWQTVSDARGVVRVHVSEWTQVVARQGNRYGMMRLHKNTVAPRDGWRLAIETDLEVLVQVLDHAGRPAAGVPIAVVQNDAKGNLVQLWRWEPVAITRSPDGIAALKHLQSWLEDAKREGNAFAEWRVRTYLPGHDDPGVGFAPDAPDAAPIVLRLPPCGTVRARAELHGKQLAAVKTITLNEQNRQRSFYMRRATRIQAVGPDGWARFEHVPLGGTFSASGNVMAGWLRKEFKGPMTQDQEVTVQIAVGDDQAVLTGRLLDASGAVLGNRDLTLSVRGQYNETSTGFTSDGDGRFLVFLGTVEKDKPRPFQQVVLAMKQPGTQLAADLSARDYRAGTQDAGDVVLRASAMVVAGRFVTGNAPSKLRLQAWVERFETVEGRPEPRWRRVRDMQFQREDDASFEIRGNAPAGRYRLSVGTGAYLPVEPIEFHVGTKDLVVAVETGAALAASVLLPKDAPDDLRALLVQDGTPRPELGLQQWRNGNDRNLVQPWSQEDGRHQLQWPAVAPGTYTLELRMWSDKEPLTTIAGIQVPAPKGGDPRLVDIDLRDLLRITTVRLFDHNGEKLDSYDGVLFPIGQPPEKEWAGYDVHGAETKLMTRPQPFDLLVARRGFRPVQVRCATTTVDVRLEPWPTIELVFEGLPELPKDASLHTRMAARDLPEIKYRSQWNEGDRNDLLTVPRSTTKLVQGRAKVAIGDGPHDVVLSLHGKRRQIPVALPQREPVFANTPNLRIDVPAAAMQQAIEKLSAPQKDQ